jgi:hypothetical protein
MPLDTQQSNQPQPERDYLAAGLAEYAHDPLGFVLAAFPWGEPGPLANASGPEPWQRLVLEDIGNNLQRSDDVVREAIASGHGVGKSCLVAWVILWAMTTCVDARVAVTANTEPQLRTKTWPELHKWYRLFKGRHWFTATATSLFFNDAEHRDNWKADALTWSENNTEAFAGLHNKGRRIVLIFDEASAIADKVWEVAEGALTDEGTEIVWLALGNPTRNTGRFRECFGSLKHRWHHQQVDSRTVSFVNKEQAAQWVTDYGEDSDFVRVRVKGEFPRAGSTQFIDGERVEQAMARPTVLDATAPLIMGVDIARQGEDQTVIRFRQGIDARSLPASKFRIPDLMQVASRVGEQIDLYKPAAVFVDATGIGAGVFDRLQQLGYQQVVAVNFGSKADRGSIGDATASYANKRAEMWGYLKNWCSTGCLPVDRDLEADLTGVEYGYDAANAILLEKKEDMRRRGLASPDDGDALALTFAYPVAVRDQRQSQRVEELYANLRRRVV